MESQLVGGFALVSEFTLLPCPLPQCIADSNRAQQNENPRRY
jgi:hypothetical protein